MHGLVTLKIIITIYTSGSGKGSLFVECDALAYEATPLCCDI